ncbi:hypothetical protein ACHAWC_011345 [Mediolabrus comicus]
MKDRCTKLRTCRETLEGLISRRDIDGVLGIKERINHCFAKYDELYKDGWTLTFVGCCHDVKYSCECRHPTSSCCGGRRRSFDTDIKQLQHSFTTPRHHHGHEDTLDDKTAFTTRFNVTALVPSVQRAYVDLWDTIELSFLGYYDAESENRTRNLHPVPSIMRTVRTTVRTSVLPELAEYLYFMVGFKPLARGGLVSRRRGRGVMGPMLSSRNTSTNYANVGTSTTIEEIDWLRNTATTMSAWKLASILRERGVGCLRCSICDCINLVGDDMDEDTTDGSEERQRLDGERGQHRRSPFLREFQKRVGDGQAWITPCQCPELVHRQCLERKLKLIPKCEPWERLKLNFVDLCRKGRRAQDMLRHPFSKESRHPTQSAQDNITLELPQRTTTREQAATRVWISYDSLSRPERNRPGGNQVESENSIIEVDNLGQFTSPDASCTICGGRYLRSVRLPRSKAEVVAASLSDPLSVVRAVSTLIHFLLACAFLAASILTVSFIPVVSRNIRFHLLEPLMGTRLIDLLQPLGDAIALANLFQYLIGSTTVICIFWRTQYRIFTIANGKEAAANLRRRQTQTRHLQLDEANNMENEGDANANHNPPVPLLRRIDGLGPGDNNAASHPMYHGPW